MKKKERGKLIDDIDLIYINEQKNFLLLCIHIIKYKKKKLNCLSDKFLFAGLHNINFVFFSKMR